MRPNWKDGSLTTVGRILSSRSSRGTHVDLNSDIPYPSPADRKDLETLVKTNWESKVQKPLSHAADHAQDQWHNAREWIFDT